LVNEEKITWKGVLQLSVKGILVALQNLLWQTIYFSIFLILSLIPIFGWIVPLVALLYEAYFYGNIMLNYNFLNQGFSIGASQKIIQQHKGYAIGNGLFFYILHLIPLIGWVVAPIYSIIAASATFEPLNNLEKK
jgi:CysZ protein